MPKTFVRIRPEPGCEDLIPKKAHHDDAAWDLFTAEPFTIELGQIKLISAGFRMELEEGWEAQVRPRSGWALKYGIQVVNSPGTIDAGFRGLVSVILKYTGTCKDDADHPSQLDFKRGERIAQMLIKEVPDVELLVVDFLNPSKRGEGGFGSTNKP